MLFNPLNERLQLTRRCLAVLVEFLNPVVIITKNELVTRDIDLLSELAKHRGAVVYVSVTSLNGDLARELEPRASQPARRLSAIEALAKAGIPTGVLVAPVIPGLTDHEMPSILAAAAAAGHAQPVMSRFVCRMDWRRCLNNGSIFMRRYKRKRFLVVSATCAAAN